MKIITSSISTALVVALLSTASMAKEATHATASEAGHEKHWSYEGDTAPAKWAELSEKNKMCGLGKTQSPINVTTTLDVDLEAIKPAYTSASKDVVNNGHTIQVNMDKGSTIDIDGVSFSLKQFHFHSPSENHIDGKSFPLEGHFVHLDADGNIAVVALMFEEGKANENIAKIWKKMPKELHQDNELKLANIAAELLPKNKDYYRFAGSLTTPPCTEGVKWLVLKTPVTISKEQVAQFLAVMHHPNNRPIQPTDARVIVK